MAIPIPSDFDFHTIPLDDNERFIRDELGLNVDHWARFRHAIAIGLDADNLRGKHGVPVTDNVKSAYRELGKSHYEVVTSLGCVALSLELAKNNYQKNFLMFQKSCKDFYFHAGCLLDNLARLIYILNDPNSAKELHKQQVPMRHYIGWGQLRSYDGHIRAKQSKELQGIRSIRNCLTHSWKIPFRPDRHGRCCWPLAVRLGTKSFLWPYDEPEFKRKYRKWIPIVPMMESDLRFLERFQDARFKRLIKDISRFERFNKVEISEP